MQQGKVYDIYMQSPRLIFVVLSPYIVQGDPHSYVSIGVTMSEPASPTYYLNPDHYKLDPELAFFKKETGIQNDTVLKKHIVAVRADAYRVCTRQYHLDERTIVILAGQVHPYPRIRGFRFTMSVPIPWLIFRGVANNILLGRLVTVELRLLGCPHIPNF